MPPPPGLGVIAAGCPEQLLCGNSKLGPLLAQQMLSQMSRLPRGKVPKDPHLTTQATPMAAQASDSSDNLSHNSVYSRRVNPDELDTINVEITIKLKCQTGCTKEQTECVLCQAKSGLPGHIANNHFNGSVEPSFKMMSISNVPSLTTVASRATEAKFTSNRAN